MDVFYEFLGKTASAKVVESMRNDQIILVKTEEILPLRSEVLRPDLPIESCFFSEDARSTHFAIKVKTEVVAIVSVFPAPEGQKATWQLRGMAVAPKKQRAGFGKQLIEAIDNYLYEKKAQRIWCNARSEAVAFYQKNGYSIISDEFIIEGVGPHFKMEKKYEL
ncbi:MAG: GNAT family N-acetyltransferase [Oligoflexia bacterium]|nr:GNAT family N-acetyltransferase [Oligoflexia bacterium]